MQIRITPTSIVLALLAFAVLQLSLYKLYGRIRIARATRPAVAVSEVAHPGATTRVSIGFVGDSISEWGNPPPPIRCAEILSRIGELRTVRVVNCAKAATTVEHWLPGGRQFEAADAAFRMEGVTLVSVMLGSNASDAKLRDVVSGLRDRGYTVVVNCTPFSTNSGEAQRLAEIRDEAAAVVREGLAVGGDRVAFDYFRHHSELLSDGLHLTQEGSDILAEMWAYPIAAALTR